ncbi:hypothetical protein CSPAE12_04915 [Colletotrichum incanum]|nr:hypothetical protein CSPAE12_04915 [Colletotrichum incanum]
MKLSGLALLVALFPSLGWSCSFYAFCRCHNADGSIHDRATEIACRTAAGNYITYKDGGRACSASTAGAGIGGVQPLFLNNCRFRQLCNANGAPLDSDCWAKA